MWDHIKTFESLKALQITGKKERKGVYKKEDIKDFKMAYAFKTDLRLAALRSADEIDSELCGVTEALSTACDIACGAGDTDGRALLLGASFDTTGAAFAPLLRLLSRYDD